jgi:DNA-binding NtrC family response regulator
MGRCTTVLVVEDDPAVRNFTLMALRHHGYRTLEAFDGRSGLASFVKHSAAIDLVLTDVVMPVSGLEMAEEILKLAPSARIVFMSGMLGLSELPGSLRGLPFLHKPFTAGRLIKCIEDCLDRHEYAGDLRRHQSHR